MENYLKFDRTMVETITINLDKVIQVYGRSGGSHDVNGGSWNDWHVEVKTYYTSELKKISKDEHDSIVMAMGDMLVGTYHIKYIRGYSADKYNIMLWYGSGKYGLQTYMDLKHLPELREKLPKRELKVDCLPKQNEHIKEDWDND